MPQAYDKSDKFDGLFEHSLLNQFSYYYNIFYFIYFRVKKLCIINTNNKINVTFVVVEADCVSAPSNLLWCWHCLVHFLGPHGPVSICLLPLNAIYGFQNMLISKWALGVYQLKGSIGWSVFVLGRQVFKVLTNLHGQPYTARLFRHCSFIFIYIGCKFSYSAVHVYDGLSQFEQSQVRVCRI